MNLHAARYAMVGLVTMIIGVSSCYSQQPATSVIDSYRQKAEQGDAEAQVMVGIDDLGTQGNVKDLPLASQWFRKSAEQGCMDGEIQLATSYEFGRGVAEDQDQSVIWYRKAAEQGSVLARLHLRTLFIEGAIIPTEDDQTGPWWRELVKQSNVEIQNLSQLNAAADEGSTDAQVQLGLAYLTGVGTPRNRSQATALLASAATQGQVKAQCLLSAITAANDDWSTAADNAHAVDLCIKAAKLGEADAQLVLADLYFMGHGVSKDETQTVAWYLKAAKQGRADAQYRLGTFYEQGRGVTRDEAQAITWYRKAAEQLYPSAEIAIGLKAAFSHAAGGTGPLKDNAVAQRYVDLGTEHTPDLKRDFLVNLWASPAQQTKEPSTHRQTAIIFLPK